MESFTQIQRTAWSLTALLLLMVSNTFAADPPPNIVFILSDDQAWSDYGFMGHADIKTPHLDKLASSSLFFDRGYVAAPICRPSLASLVTGLFPHQHGVTGNDVAWGPDRSGYFSTKRHELDAPLRAAFHKNDSFIRLLTSNGYLAHQSGKWWEGSWEDGGFTHGMTHGDPERGGRHGDDGLTIGRTSMKPVTGFIDHAVEQKKPFLLWYAPFLPHTPHNPPKRLLEKYTMPGRAKDVAKYYAMIEWFDETCGELLDYLKEKDLTKNTIVIYICDNGWAARSTRPDDPHQKTFGHFALRSKASPYENGTRTPIMISWPGHVTPKKSNHLAHAIDIFPTIAAAVGLKTPEHLTGINLLDEEAVKNRKAVFGVTHSTHNMSPQNPDEALQYIWCVEDNWKLLVRYPGKDLTEWRKLHDWDKEPVRLYDVTKDPHETKEVSEAHPEVVARLKKTIEAWRAATKKPGTSAGDPPFVPLFNGKDLTNFQTEGADTFWRIEDGVLIGENDAEKKGHYLWTTKKYSDFILDFDAKWKGSTKRGVDTGIELREPKLQLQLGISGSLRVDMTGSFYAGRKGYPKSGQATEAKRLLNPEGEWNSFRLQAKGNTFSCWINGEKASEYTDANFSGAAPLALQIHGGVVMKVEYRNLRIADLAADVNLAPVAEPSTSHVSRDTSLAALHDGHAPKVSRDRGEGAYGNWPSKGTQWVQYDWAAPVDTRKIDVFWWADGGGIGVPKAYRVLYWDGKRFVPVRNPSGLGVAKDTFNTTTFDEVRTSKLRLEIDGDSDGHSTGILEWKVYNEGELPNFPPSVMAGVDRIVMQGRETPFAGQLLRAISTDTTKLTWSKTSGPGEVAFADDAALATTATFSAVGDYVLTLTARKGKMSDSSTLAVRVVARPKLDIRAAGKTGIRITIQPHDSKDTFPYTPALVERDYPKAVISLRELDSAFEPVKARVGQMNVTVQSNPLSVQVTTLDNEPLQKITFAPDGTMSFVLDDQPVLGMGEGGPKQTGDSWRTDKIELDRRGRLHPMTPWYRTGTYGSSNPVPLMVGTGGWGMFIPTPWGAIDLSDAETGKFIPAEPIAPGTVVSRGQQRKGRIGMPPPEAFIPGTYDVFVFDTQNPPAFMKDISTLSGPAVLPPKWVMGYQQSHRNLKDETQMLEIIDTFRKKNIPLDSVCYLGTGFTPNGWNKNQPSFEFNPGVFKHDPKEVLADMHKRDVKVMMHMIPWDRDRLETIQGTIPPKPGEKLDNTHIQNYWNEHNALVDAGVDAWWPDEGDWFDFHERMKRHELYYTGPLSKQPNVRPWSLHRNGYLGVARWGGWMWPGDPLATWRTLETHIAIGINHSLSVSPFWNSDIGAFYTTDEYSAELYVRWVQFAAFNSLMRSHGRGWENRLPWTWGSNKSGPGEGSYAPPASEMNNPTVEPIAKKYIELRYQLLSYNYTLTWEARETGMPMMRSLWLHYPKDKKARGIGDEYLWGRDLLIAPVYEKGATTRDVYLPAGKWYDWWTGKLETGGRTVQRAVDLATMPIYVRGGAIVPVDPIRQYTGENVDEPTTLKIYRGANGNYTLYGDDGISLDYLKGDSVQTLIKWDDAAKTLSLEPASKQTAERKFKIELIPDGVTKEIQYTGQRVELKF